MVLNEVARQTGVYVRTLRYRAQKLFGRTKGEFTDEEVTVIGCFKTMAKDKGKCFP